MEHLLQRSDSGLRDTYTASESAKVPMSISTIFALRERQL